MSRASSLARRIEGLPVQLQTFRDRLLRAWALLQLREGGILSQTWLAGEVARELGMEETMSPSTVSYWFAGVRLPGDLDTMAALARVLRVDPGWLAFGDASQAPAPPDPFKQSTEATQKPRR